MAATVSYNTTAPDATFSATGNTAWKRALIVTTFNPVPPIWTFPDADATMAYGAVTSNTFALGAGSGQVQDSIVTYNSVYTGVDAVKEPYPAAVITGGGLAATHTRTDAHNTPLVLMQYQLLLNPSADQSGSQNSTVQQLSGGTVNGTTTKNIKYFTGQDIFLRHSAAVSMDAMVGANAAVTVDGAGSITTGIAGASFGAFVTNASAVVPTVAGASISMAPTAGSWNGTVTNLYGLNFVDMNYGSATLANRAVINIPTMTGTPGTSDYVIKSAATQASALTGKLALGGIFAPTSTLSFVKEATASIGAERSTTASQAGATVTLAAGGATAGTGNLTGGTLAFAAGVSVGNGNSQISLYTYTNTAAAGSDNTLVEALRLGSNGKTTVFAGLTTVGMGLATILKDGQSATINTATTTTLQSLTPAAVSGRYMVMGCFTTDSNTNNGTVKFTVDYVDSQGTTHTADILQASDATGAMDADGVITVAASKEYFFGPRMISIDASATAIAIKAVTTATISGKGSADIIRLG